MKWLMKNMGGKLFQIDNFKNKCYLGYVILDLDLSYI